MLTLHPRILQIAVVPVLSPLQDWQRFSSWLLGINCHQAVVGHPVHGFTIQTAMSPTLLLSVARLSLVHSSWIPFFSSMLMKGLGIIIWDE